MTIAEGLVPDPAAPSSPAPAAPPRHRVRRVVTWVLVVLFALLTPITLLSAWAVRTVTDTDRYVATLQPLAEDPVVTNYVADQATTKLFDQLDVQQRIAKVLPFGGAVIAAPITAQLQGYTDAQMRKVVSSKWFARLWERENRYTHSTAVDILTGKPSPPTSKFRSLVVDLSPAIIQGIDKLDAKGVTVFNPLRDHLQTNRTLTLKIFSSKQLKQAQGIFRLAIDLRWILLIGTPLIGIAAILIAVERRRAALRVALAGVLGCLLLAAGLTFARSEFISLAPASGDLFAQHVFDTLLRFLHSALRWTLLVFVLLSAGLWVAGDSKWAVGLRRALRGAGGKLAEGAEAARQSEAAARASEQLVRAGRWVSASQAPVRWTGVAVAGVVILFSSSTGTVVWSLLLLAAFQTLVSLVIWWSRRDQGPDGPSQDGEGEVAATPVA